MNVVFHRVRRQCSSFSVTPCNSVADGSFILYIFLVLSLFSSVRFFSGRKRSPVARSGSNEATRSRTKGWFPVGLRGRAYKLTSLESLYGDTRGRFQFVSQPLKLPGRHNFLFFVLAAPPLIHRPCGPSRKIITVRRHCHLHQNTLL